jgi:hypothetical protein
MPKSKVALSITLTSSSVATNITNCARCGKNHATVQAFAFVNPPPRFTHWATCPTTADPILITVMDDREALPAGYAARAVRKKRSRAKRKS